MPLFSVIMRTYNRASYLAEAINSVLNQTEPDFELVVCDDGSTDSTEKLMAYFTKKDPRVVYLKKPHTGIADTGNYAIAHSHGQLIVQADSDDIQLPDKLAIYKEVFADAAVDFAYTGYYHCNPKGEIWQEIHPQEFTLANIKNNTVCAGESLGYRKKVWEQTPYRADYVTNDDVPFLYDLYQAGWKWKLVDKPTFKYRLLKNSTSYAQKQAVNDLTKKFWKETDGSDSGLRLP